MQVSSVNLHLNISNLPDVIAISGDLADGYVANLGNVAFPLRHLQSKYGTYFVTGKFSIEIRLFKCWSFILR
jgi:predicted MPP superfamily phosphohydrolase